MVNKSNKSGCTEELIKFFYDNVPLPDGMVTMNIESDSRIVEEFGLSSVEVMEIIGKAEDYFDVLISLDDLENIQTVGDLAKKIDEQIQN